VDEAATGTWASAVATALTPPRPALVLLDAVATLVEGALVASLGFTTPLGAVLRAAELHTMTANANPLSADALATTLLFAFVGHQSAIQLGCPCSTGKP
jgi:hypothetical protein